MYAEKITPEEELLLAAAEVESVSSSLRLRVLSAARDGRRRRRARREMEWVAASLLVWGMLTQMRSSPLSPSRIVQVALAPFRGDGGGRGDEIPAFTGPGFRRGVTSRQIAMADTWQLDDLMHGENAQLEGRMSRQENVRYKLPALETMRSQWRELMG